MDNLVAFFEIPAENVERAVKFYEAVVDVKLDVMCECETEKMAFFPAVNGLSGAISQAKDFYPSKDGVLIHFKVANMETALTAVEKNGGKITRPKTKIEADGWGYFALFIDSEGNSVGVCSDE